MLCSQASLRINARAAGLCTPTRLEQVMLWVEHSGGEIAEGSGAGIWR